MKFGSLVFLGFLSVGALALLSCSSRFDTGLGGRPAPATAPPMEAVTYDDELRTLREERTDLDNRITAARMREDTSGLGNRSPFPEQEAHEDVNVLVHRRKTVESRIRDLEAREGSSPESEKSR